MTEAPSRSQPSTESPTVAGPVFVTTHWSVVLAAGARDTTRAYDALSRLCQSYWYPLYAYVRRRGYSSPDAEDLTQGFFARLLQKESLLTLSREGGRFRSFLLKSLNHFLTDEWRRATARKRGGGQPPSLDAATAETRYQLEPTDERTPETLYDRSWALALLNSTYQRLSHEYTQAGKGALFDQLKFCLTGERSAIPYAELASQLRLPENTLKTLVHRLRQRYRALLHEEVAQTVSSTAEVEEELRALFRALT